MAALLPGCWSDVTELFQDWDDVRHKKDYKDCGKASESGPDMRKAVFAT